MKHRFFLFLVGLFVTVLFTEQSAAIPAFSRKYKTSCSTCHYAFPMLNAFGKAFRNNGYRYPGVDADYIKEEPVSLGSEGQKRAWPNAIWPADMPGTSPFSVRAISRINYEALSAVKWNLELPHEAEVLYAGTIGENFSFFGEVELENEDGETEIAFPLFLQYDHSPRFHVTAGMVSADPTPTHSRLTRNHYNVASLRTRNGFRLRDDHFGLEVWGAMNGPNSRGGFMYRAGVVNGQGGLSDVNKDKDFYGRATYKIGGLGVTGGAEAGASETTDFFIDNSLALGAFGYIGTASGAGEDEDFRIFGGDVDFWYDRFILNGMVMLMNSEIPGTSDRKSMAYYAQGQYVLYPWLIGVVRYEWEDRNTDDDAVKPINSIVPGVTLMARADVKLVFELKKPLDDANDKRDTFTVQIEFGI